MITNEFRLYNTDYLVEECIEEFPRFTQAWNYLCNRTESTESMASLYDFLYEANRKSMLETGRGIVDHDFIWRKLGHTLIIPFVTYRLAGTISSVESLSEYDTDLLSSYTKKNDSILTYYEFSDFDVEYFSEEKLASYLGIRYIPNLSKKLKEVPIGVVSRLENGEVG